MAKQYIKSVETKIRILYPFWILLAVFSVAYVPSITFIKDDMNDTLTKVTDNDIFFRLGIVGTIATAVLMAYIAYYLYLLFEKVNKNSALLMLVLALISVPFIGFELFKFVSIGSDNAQYVYNNLNISQSAMMIASVFWGLWLYPLGKLVIKSGYFPKFLGYLLIASCFGYLLGVFIKIVLPTLEYGLIGTEVLTFGEVVFALWFVFRGINKSVPFTN